MKTIRRVALLVITALGMVAANTIPAFAGTCAQQPVRAHARWGLVMKALRRTALLVSPGSAAWSPTRSPQPSSASNLSSTETT